MAEPWLAEIPSKGSEGTDVAEDGCKSGRGLLITSPNGAKASRVRGTASTTSFATVSVMFLVGEGILKERGASYPTSVMNRTRQR